MKKLLLVLIFALLPYSAFAAFDTNLKYGAKGSPVTELQEFLIDKGFLNTQSSGNFFSLTLAAVKKFQTANNLPSTGYFGPMSREVANTLIASDISASNNAEVTETGNTTAPVDTNTLDSLNQKITDLTAQISSQKAIQQDTNLKMGQIVQNTTPAPVQTPPLAPEPVKTLTITAMAEDFTKIQPDGSTGKYVPIQDGDTIFMTKVTGTSPNFPDGVVQVTFSSQYLVDGVRPQTYSGTWSYSPWDYDFLGSLDNKTTSFTICDRGYPTCSGSSFGGGFPMTHLGQYVFTVTIDGVTKTFTINVAPDPVCATVTADECGTDYLTRLKAFIGQ